MYQRDSERCLTIRFLGKWSKTVFVDFFKNLYVGLTIVSTRGPHFGIQSLTTFSLNTYTIKIPESIRPTDYCRGQKVDVHRPISKRETVYEEKKNPDVYIYKQYTHAQSCTHLKMKTIRSNAKNLILSLSLPLSFLLLIGEIFLQCIYPIQSISRYYTFPWQYMIYLVL